MIYSIHKNCRLKLLAQNGVSNSGFQRSETLSTEHRKGGSTIALDWLQNSLFTRTGPNAAPVLENSARPPQKGWDKAGSRATNFLCFLQSMKENIPIVTASKLPSQDKLSSCTSFNKTLFLLFWTQKDPTWQRSALNTSWVWERGLDRSPVIIATSIHQCLNAHSRKNCHLLLALCRPVIIALQRLTGFPLMGNILQRLQKELWGFSLE